MGKNVGGALLGYLVGAVVIGLVGFALTTGVRYLNAGNSMQREAKVALEEYIDGGEDFPVGEYVSLNARWVIGPFATETSTSSVNFITATSGVAQYYFAVLADDTIMAVKTENTAEIEALNRMTDWLLSVEGFPMNGETLKLQGKLRQMKEGELMDMYRQNVREVFGVSSGSPSVRLLVLDTTAGREQLYFILIGGLAVLVLVFVLVRRSKKKKAAQAAGDMPAAVDGQM